MQTSTKKKLLERWNLIKIRFLLSVAEYLRIFRDAKKVIIAKVINEFHSSSDNNINKTVDNDILFEEMVIWIMVNQKTIFLYSITNISYHLIDKLLY